MYELLTSKVIDGKKRARTLWFPTINCPIASVVPWLASGTYRVNVLIDETTYRGIGPRFPDRQLFEVHLLDISEDLYSKDVTIIPLAYIRENIQPTSVEQLQSQIEQDLLRVEEHPQLVITFGTFDHFHPGHEVYLLQAKQYGDYLITIIARDRTVERIKGNLPEHDEDERLLSLTEFGQIDIVELWDSEDPYTCLRTYKPQVICLGYDQHSFDTWLRKRCDTNNLKDTTILRLQSFEPEKRKSSYFRTQV
jgi:cytidyltransferase-like protein